VTTHAVSYNRQPALARELSVVGRLPLRIVVFVIFSLAADVAHACQLNSGPYSHHTSYAAFDADL